MCNFKQFGDEQQNTSGFSGFTVSAALDMMRHNILISRLISGENVRPILMSEKYHASLV